MLLLTVLLPCLSAYANANPFVLFYGPAFEYYYVPRGPPAGGPVWFTVILNTIHPLLMPLGSVLRLGYMDDVTLDGTQDAVARDFQTVMDVGHDIGLGLNISKCELISHPGFVVSDSAPQSFLQIPVPDAELVCFPALFWIQFGHSAVLISLEQLTGWHLSVHRMPLFCLGLFQNAKCAAFAVLFAVG